MDWGVGRYESTAAELAPASEATVDAAALAEGEIVLDVACGTGNAAAVAAARGADVVGVDAAERLLGVARERVPAGEFLRGDLERLPVGDASFDAVVSVFGVIFAHDARRAAAELRRVVRPGGRIVLATWVDRGPIADLMRAVRAAAPGADAPREAGDAGAGASPYVRLDWGDPATLEELLGPGTLTVTEHAIPVRATSPRAWIDRQDRDHPAWHALRATIPAATWATTLDTLTDLLAAATETTDGTLLVHSPYLVARVDVPPS